MPTATAATLPSDPKESDYEDFVAAMLLTSGHFVEGNTVLRDGNTEVLEFDAVITPAAANSSDLLVEAKSGSCGIADLFKLFGQSTYTAITPALLIHRVPFPQEKRDVMSRLASGTSVECINLTLDNLKRDDGNPLPIHIAMDPRLRKLATQSARFHNAADRAARARFKSWAKSGMQVPDVSLARDYEMEIAQSFFAKTPGERAQRIYAAYQSFPQATQRCARVVDPASDGAVIRECWTTQNHLYIQYMMNLEHKARIRIINMPQMQLFVVTILAGNCQRLFIEERWHSRGTPCHISFLTFSSRFSPYSAVFTFRPARMTCRRSHRSQGYLRARYYEH